MTAPDDGRDYLRAAVDRLARVRVLRQETSNEAGIVCVGEYEAPPLLEELRAAKAGGTGAHAGASMKAKIPLNADAVDLYDAIEAEVLSWAVQAGVDLSPLLEQTLIRWYVAFARHRGKPAYSDALEDERTGELERWARRIEGLFNPVRTIELTRPALRPVVDLHGDAVLHKRGPLKGRPMMREGMVPERCPVCSADHAFTPRTGDRITALVIEYRTTHEDGVEDVIARCRSCETVWKGIVGVRALRWDLDNTPETALATG